MSLSAYAFLPQFWQFTSGFSTQNTTMTQAAPATLAVAMMVAGYNAATCLAPPNRSPQQKDRHQTDRISFIAGHFATVLRWMTIIAITYHVLLTVAPAYVPSRMSQLCPRPENLNQALFTWNARSVTALLLIYLGTFVRLSAYGELGRHFTFHLAAPGQLVTSGIYRWIQHPSYTGLALVSVGCAHLFMQFNGTLACWISESTLAQLQQWGPFVVAGVSLFGLCVLFARVRDEEEMLRQQFGEEWEKWHRSTKRFIPFLL